MSSLSRDNLAEHLFELQLDAKSELGIYERKKFTEVGGEQIKQEPSLLHNSTGAMVWRSTVEFASFLQENPQHKLAKMVSGTVLELGCGTGALAKLISPLCSSYIATDQKSLLKLVAENTSDCHNVQIEQYDWELDNPPEIEPTCVVACDTIYNDYLVPHFLDAFDEVRQGSPMILVVQIREPDMLEAAFMQIVERFSLQFELVTNGVAIYTVR